MIREFNQSSKEAFHTVFVSLQCKSDEYLKDLKTNQCYTRIQRCWLVPLVHRYKLGVTFGKPNFVSVNEVDHFDKIRIGV